MLRVHDRILGEQNSITLVFVHDRNTFPSNAFSFWGYSSPLRSNYVLHFVSWISELITKNLSKSYIFHMNIHSNLVREKRLVIPNETPRGSLVQQPCDRCFGFCCILVTCFPSKIAPFWMWRVYVMGLYGCRGSMAIWPVNWRYKGIFNRQLTA